MRALPVALLLTASLFAAGCGGDDEEPSGSSTPAAETTAAPETTEDTATTEGTATTEDSTEDSGGSSVTDAAIQACQDSVDNNPQIPDNIKSDIKDICERAAGTTDPEELQQISREVCEKVVEASLPAGEQRDTAIQACSSAGQ